MDTSSPKPIDPMLICPNWCDLTEHDQVERLDRLTHWRTVLTLDDVPTDSPEDADEPTTRVGVDVIRNGYKAPVTVRLSVGDQLGSSASLTIKQARAVITALAEAINVVVGATPTCPSCGDPVPTAQSSCRCLDEHLGTP